MDYRRRKGKRSWKEGEGGGGGGEDQGQCRCHRTHLQLQGCHDLCHDVITLGVDDQGGPGVQRSLLEVDDH